MKMILLVTPSASTQSLNGSPLCFVDGGGCNHCENNKCTINFCDYKSCQQYCVGYLCHPTKLSPTGNLDCE